MNFAEVKAQFENFPQEGGLLELPEEFFQNLSVEEARELVGATRGNILMRLSERDIKFFEWLKIADPPVWLDLWGTGDEDPYIVSIAFLPLLVYAADRGFPICDLMEVDNYYFTPAHMVDEESKVMIEASKNRLRDAKDLDVEQLLSLEISIEGIDIWRFSYKYNIPLEKSKEAVRKLVEDGALVHLRSSEHLSHFIDF
ncbi:MAG: hypothetical protein ACM3U1_06555 [Chloroflexota bacterium]